MVFSMNSSLQIVNHRKAPLIVRTERVCFLPAFNILSAVAKTHTIDLPTGESLPILYEDRAVLAIDKPAGWMLVPFSWQQTSRNLQAALASSIAARDF